MNMMFLRRALLLAFGGAVAMSARAQRWVEIVDVPNYAWHAGCFGTASGNLMGFWDRNGFPDFYTGPTGGGIAPLDTVGGNWNIRGMWASQRGVDGRPSTQDGHMDDYWGSQPYEGTAPDPYVLDRRPEHEPDCIGDFIGLSQNKWTNMNNECDGNINAYSFVFWDPSGNRRVNFVPPPQGTNPVPDIPSGLRAWTRWRGYEADVFSQLTDFNPTVSGGRGFSFEDLKREIDAGYPVLLYLQSFTSLHRSLPGMPRANPLIHGMLAYGYYDGFGSRFVYFRNSWGDPDPTITIHEWNADIWVNVAPVRGVIGFHPKPRIRSVKRKGGNLTIRWDGPAARLLDRSENQDGVLVNAHRYQLEQATSLNPPNFAPVGPVTAALELTVPDTLVSNLFLRVRLIER